ncbi:hypothetical protein K523DRAFT_367386, partial [Schizophyllum commune Tattone D]
MPGRRGPEKVVDLLVLTPGSEEEGTLELDAGAGPTLGLGTAELDVVGSFPFPFECGFALDKVGFAFTPPAYDADRAIALERLPLPTRSEMMRTGGSYGGDAVEDDEGVCGGQVEGVCGGHVEGICGGHVEPAKLSPEDDEKLPNPLDEEDASEAEPLDASEAEEDASDAARESATEGPPTDAVLVPLAVVAPAPLALVALVPLAVVEVCAPTPPTSPFTP